MSEYGELISPDTVRFERQLPGPIERVWAYLTDAEKRARWLAGGDTEQRVGGKVALHFHNANLSSRPDDAPPEKYRDLPQKMSFSGTVTRCEPPRLLAYTWAGEDEDEASEVTFELSERGDEVLLLLTHRRIAKRDVLGGIAGWHTHLDILADVLAGKEPQPFWNRHTVHEDDYSARLDLSVG